jgi:hypothetical protein
VLAVLISLILLLFLFFVVRFFVPADFLTALFFDFGADVMLWCRHPEAQADLFYPVT